MRGLRSVAAAIFVLFTLAASAPRADDIVQPQGLKFPELDVQNNEVYGVVNYKLTLTNPGGNAEVKRSVSSFLRNAIGALFGQNDEGSYIVAISIKNGTQEVARKAILSFAWKSNKFLFFFTKSSDESSFSSFSGVLADHFPVTAFNNNLSVALQLTKTRTIVLDTDTYNKFSEQAGLLNFASLHPAIALAAPLKQSLAIMATVLDSYEKRDLTSELLMSFIKKAGNPNPNQATFVLTGPGFKNNFITVQISFDTEPTLLRNFDAASKKFVGLDLHTVIAMARIGGSGASMEFTDALDDVNHRQLIDVLRTLDEGRLPDGMSAKALCLKLFDAAEEFFSQRDGPAIYAALLDRYEDVLSQRAGAKAACIDNFKATLDNLGIPYADEIKIMQ